MTAETRSIFKHPNWMNGLAFAWIILAFLSIFPVVSLLGAALPIFHVLWLIVPLVVLLITRRPASLGIRAITGPVFLRYTAANLGLLMLAMLLVEPWSHTYQALVDLAVGAKTPDVTFAWLARFPGLPGLAGMLLYSGLVTLFGEELFFRGWLLQAFLKRMRPVWAIALQAFLFTIPQALAALFLTPLQGALYIGVYSFLAIGCIGGWAAWKTGSIWPSLLSAAVMNLVFVILFR